MGCDIHTVIEYNKFGYSFDAFTEGEISIPRDYDLFTAIAFGDGGIKDNLPYPPRGLPPDHSLEVSELFFVPAEDVKRLADETDDEETFNPEEIAKSWGEWALNEYQSYGSLPGHDWHTPSWLNLTELREALVHAKIESDALSTEFRAVLAAMQVLAEEFGAGKVRLVFWFDG